MLICELKNRSKKDQSIPYLFPKSYWPNLDKIARCFVIHITNLLPMGIIIQHFMQ